MVFSAGKAKAVLGMNHPCCLRNRPFKSRLKHISRRAQLLPISSGYFRLRSAYLMSVSSTDIYILKNLCKPRWFSLLLLRHTLLVWAVRGFPDYSFSQLCITITFHSNYRSMKIKCFILGKSYTFKQSPAIYLSLLHFAGTLIQPIFVKKMMSLNLICIEVFLR